MTAKGTIINSKAIDYTQLIGKEIKLITEQFPGNILATKVLSTGDNNLILDKSGSSGKVSQLINRQNVEAHFHYKGEPIAFTSTIITTASGRIQIPIALKVTPMLRRKFVRFDLEKDIRLTFFDDRSIKTARLNKLKWIETTTANIGGGGVLTVMPTSLEEDYYIVMNLGFNDLDIPHLILARVCHCRRGENKKILVGAEFIIKETAKEIVPQSVTRNLPEGVFLFDEKYRRELANYLEKKYRNLMDKGEIQ